MFRFLQKSSPAAHRSLSSLASSARSFAPATGKTPITVAAGDGIGPEITEATMRVLEASQAKIYPEYVQIGEKSYLQGHLSGIDDSAWALIRRNKVLLKGPITTPQGDGYKSLNVSLRKTLGLYANVRPVSAYHPFVPTKHPKMDLVIVRENEEDLYAGIEHRQTLQVTQCLKLISAPGSERVIRFAFEYAAKNNRKKVTCFIKDNIMKMTDGLFHKIFHHVANEYPHIQKESLIVDIGAARLADTPEKMDVLVMPNLYGDVMSDIASQIAGSVGFGSSANVGDIFSMFEAIHGSALQIAGKNIANPSGMLLSAVMMLVHIGEPETASVIHNAWLRTIEDGDVTVDLAKPGSKAPLSTSAFAEAVIKNLGKVPQKLPPVQYAAAQSVAKTIGKDGMRLNYQTKPEIKELVGIDVFLDWNYGTADELGEKIKLLSGDGLELKMITNRGVKVWPNGFPETQCVDHWRCRFKSNTSNGKIDHSHILSLLLRFHNAGLDFIKTENLFTFDGKPGYALAQSE